MDRHELQIWRRRLSSMRVVSLLPQHGTILVRAVFKHAGYKWLLLLMGGLLQLSTLIPCSASIQRVIVPLSLSPAYWDGLYILGKRGCIISGAFGCLT